MISVILIWIYVLITVFLLGYGFAAIWNKFTNYQLHNVKDILMAGLVIVTVYAQFYSLFSGVTVWEHLLLCLTCVIVAILNRSVLVHYGREVFVAFEKQKATKEFLILAGLFLLMAYGSSKGYMHYDTALYHAQSIRWVEEYGIVKGLGNLHCRLAYNSAAFPLTALYSMHLSGGSGQSFHVMAGFFAFLLALECTELRKVIGRKTLLLSDYARVMALYYLLIIFDEMVSPASDYFMVLTCFYLIIRWLTLLERKEKRPEGYGLLCLLGVFLLTVKLSAAVILLLTLMPACMLIREKKYKEIGAFIACGFVTALPYLIRNVIISGWLVYPFTSLDLFPVDWKIPKGIAEYDAKEIQVWGRGYTDVLQFDLPITKWFGNWFAKQGGMDKGFILLAFAAVFALIIRWIYWGVVKRTMHKDDSDAYAEKMAVLWLETTLASCFLFWVSTSPLIRYGCVYVWLTGVIIAGDVIESMFQEKQTKKFVYLLLLLFGCYKLFMFGKEIVLSFTPEYLLVQEDYDNYAVEEYQIGNITFYHAAAGDQTGYEPFPSAPVKANLLLRGEKLEDGFVSIQ